MNLTHEQQDELRAILAQHGIDTFLRDLSYMISDGCSVLNAPGNTELQTAILMNSYDIMKAADSITFRSWTGKDLFYEVSRA